MKRAENFTIEYVLDRLMDMTLKNIPRSNTIGALKLEKYACQRKMKPETDLKQSCRIFPGQFNGNFRFDFAHDLQGHFKVI